MRLNERRPFKIGDMVTSGNVGPFEVVEIEKPDDSLLSLSAVDMGRYKLRAPNGDTFSNMPGYLQRHTDVEAKP